MNILKYGKTFINWCNLNVGFLNVLLSLCTLRLSVSIARMPYKKKIVGTLEIMTAKTGDPYFECFIKVYLTNVGNVPIYIKRVEITDWKGKSLGTCLMRTGHRECQELERGKSYFCEGMFVDPIFERHAMDLNGHVKIRVTDINGKKYYISRTFPVG